jgi:serine protease Do
MVSQTKPKTKASFKILRDGKERTLNVTLAELPTQRELAGMIRRPGSAPGAQANQPETLEGVEVADLEAKSRRQHGIPNHVRGALVTNVDPESSAYEAGLRPGDVLLEIERKPVANADDAIELTDNFKGSKVLLRVWSRGSTRYVFVNVGSNEQEKREQKSDEDSESER